MLTCTVMFFLNNVVMSALIVNALYFECISTSEFCSYVILSHNCCSVCSIWLIWCFRAVNKSFIDELCVASHVILFRSWLYFLSTTHWAHSLVLSIIIRAESRRTFRNKITGLYRSAVRPGPLSFYEEHLVLQAKGP